MRYTVTFACSTMTLDTDQLEPTSGPTQAGFSSATLVGSSYTVTGTRGKGALGDNTMHFSRILADLLSAPNVALMSEIPAC